MSPLHPSAPYRRGEVGAVRVPVVLPLVQVSVDETGLLEVALDRAPYAGDSSLTREDLGRLLNEITLELASPVKVEIHEPDGTVFTDIITPDQIKLGQINPAQSREGASGPQVAPVQALKATITTGPGGVTGEGFLPHEDVAVAVIVAHQSAESDGTAQLRLPPALLAAHAGAVVLLGRSSGMVALSSDPAPDGGPARGGVQ